MSARQLPCLPFYLHHVLAAADKDSGAALQDLDLVAAYLAKVDLVNVGHCQVFGAEAYIPFPSACAQAPDYYQRLEVAEIEGDILEAVVGEGSPRVASNYERLLKARHEDMDSICLSRIGGSG